MTDSTTRSKPPTTLQNEQLISTSVRLSNTDAISHKETPSDRRSAPPTPTFAGTTFSPENALQRLGRKSLELLESGDFGELDPTVGDWACQLRVLWLIDLANRYAGLLQRGLVADSQEQRREHAAVVLSCTDLQILGMYRLLSFFESRENDGLGMLRRIQTNQRITTLAENQAGWKIGSSRQNKVVYWYAKDNLGDCINAWMANALRNSHLPYAEIFASEFERTDIARYAMMKTVSVVGFFAGFKAVLDLAAVRNVPLVVTLRKFIRDRNHRIHLVGNDVELLEAAKHPDGLRYVLRDKSNSNLGDEASMVIHMYACFAEGDADNDVHAFFETARELAFNKIHQSAEAICAMHPQLPNNLVAAAPGAKIGGHAHLPKDPAEVPTAHVCIERHATVQAMRRDAEAFARATGVGGRTYYEFGKRGASTSVGAHFKASVPLQIYHIQTGTLNKVIHEIDAYGREYMDKTIDAE